MENYIQLPHLILEFLGWAMSQYLPVGGFEWIQETSQFTEERINSMKDEQDIGYMMEVDLEYPSALHDEHDQVDY